LTLHKIIVLGDNLHLIGRVSDGTIVLDIEKVGTAQMCVPIRLARVYLFPVKTALSPKDQDYALTRSMEPATSLGRITLALYRKCPDR
jgi:hypothetical protein